MEYPKSTTWSLDPHTVAKHKILQHYLEAWFPILSKWQGRIVYYDGFAGPGRYAGGERGSRLVALDVARTHRSRLAEVVFIFVESDPDRAQHLRSELEAVVDLPGNFRCQVQEMEFHASLTKTLDELAANNLNLAPTFAFVDPFGIVGLPFRLIERLLRNRSCEVLITFMSVTMQRFAGILAPQIDELIGKEGAARLIEAAGDSERRAVVAAQLYDESLRRAARFVRFFRMRDRSSRPLYDLFFATNDALGHVKMKEAMWKLDATGDFSFSDGVNPAQATLFTRQPERDLANMLWSRFRGTSVWTDEILEYTLDGTPYIEKHCKKALRLLESGGEDGRKIVADAIKNDGSRRKANTYPKGVRITFQDE